MPNFATALLLAIASVVLASCGQTGPLYMPNEEPPKVESAPAGAGEAAEQQQQEF